MIERGQGFLQSSTVMLNGLKPLIAVALYFEENLANHVHVLKTSYISCVSPAIELKATLNLVHMLCMFECEAAM